MQPGSGQGISNTEFRLKSAMRLLSGQIGLIMDARIGSWYLTHVRKTQWAAKPRICHNQNRFSGPSYFQSHHTTEVIQSQPSFFAEAYTTDHEGTVIDD